MIELDDIQHFLIERPRALAARYEFLTFRNPEGGCSWLAGIIEKVGIAQAVRTAGETEMRWVTVAFTWNGPRALGVDEASLATFPEEFRQGMAARAEILGDTGANHPDNWVGGLASPDLHAIVILFARDVAERERCVREHQQYASQFAGLEVLSVLDLEATPPYDYPHEHFGYRDRISTPAIEGIDDETIPGSGPPIKAGEFFLGYPDEGGAVPQLPQPEILSRNGSYLAYRRLQEHVGVFRDFLQGVVFLSVEAGFRLGRHRSQRPEHEPEMPVGSIVGSTLGLLAFMLAFTFGMAESRYDAKRLLVIDEANAIRTTYLRAGFLPEPQRTKFRGLLREYVTVRAEGAKTGKVGAAIARSEELQDRIWAETAALAEKNPNPMAGLFIQSLNEAIALYTKRIEAGWNRLPGVIWVGLSLVMILAMIATGYQAGLVGKRSSLLTITLVLAFSAVILLIADLDSELKGWLNVSQQAMIDLQEKMKLPGQ